MIRLPNNSQRISIIGKTGSGKTHAGLWHLSIRDFKIPWVIINSKNDSSFNIEHARYIDYDYNFKNKDKGLFIIVPYPEEKDELNQFLLKLWAKERIGILVDEAADIGDLPAYERIVRQGRSKNIPVIQLTQRPVGVSRYVISESDFFQIFFINDERDIKTIQSFVPLEKSIIPKQQTRKSLYYNVLDDKIDLISPLPPPELIYERLNEKLRKKFNFI